MVRQEGIYSLLLGEPYFIKFLVRPPGTVQVHTVSIVVVLRHIPHKSISCRFHESIGHKATRPMQSGVVPYLGPRSMEPGINMKTEYLMIGE